jgi:drug/metabolite transporter (DMT)-like permease
MTAEPNRRDAAHNLRGSLFMVAAMAAFAVEDALLKLAAVTVPVGQVLVLFGLFGVVVYGLMCLRAGEAPVTRALLGRVMILRSLAEVTGRLFFMLALALTPVSTTSAILQAAPLIVIAGAAILFGERVGTRRWIAVGIGLVGVLVILRPGAGFGWLSLLAVVATCGFAGRDLATRAAPLTLSHRQLGVSGFLMLIVAGGIALPFGAAPVWPALPAALGLVGAGIAGVGAYTALTMAMRTGEVAAVTPFRYTRLVFAMIAGVAVFHERPDLWTLVGSVIVVGAGLVALRSR